jgi:hypothetical protein
MVFFSKPGTPFLRKLPCKLSSILIQIAQSWTLSRNFIWDLALTKLYSNCLLSTLNARASLKEMTSHQSGNRQASTIGGSRRPVSVQPTLFFFASSCWPTHQNTYLDQPLTPVGPMPQSDLDDVWRGDSDTCTVLYVRNAAKVIWYILRTIISLSSWRRRIRDNRDQGMSTVRVPMNVHFSKFRRRIHRSLKRCKIQIQV